MNEDDITEAELTALLDGHIGLSSGAELGFASAVEAVRPSTGTTYPPPVSPALNEFVAVNLIVDEGDLLATAASNALGPALQAADCRHNEYHSA